MRRTIQRCKYSATSLQVWGCHLLHSHKFMISHNVTVFSSAGNSPIISKLICVVSHGSPPSNWLLQHQAWTRKRSRSEKESIIISNISIVRWLYWSYPFTAECILITGISKNLLGKKVKFSWLLVTLPNRRLSQWQCYFNNLALLHWVMNSTTSK